ncbi:PIG-L family deacetylase [Candidatus Gribaldobacteria bacterium]|nr:PIG-L family deacetylase [Candidatus Gribaldobacteria bacterium]
MKETILVVASHPDDEALGCGGTILKHSSRGDDVFILFLADGESSRDNFSLNQDEKNLIERRKQSGFQVAKILGVKEVFSEKLPDNKCDSLPLLEIVKIVENVIEKTRPTIIYTHNPSDLNIDHQLAFKAVLTAARPSPGFFVKKILAFEVLSSTEWQMKEKSTMFCPNVYEDITGFIEKKITALKCYHQEMREYPHPRSYEGVLTLSKYRGIESGYQYAEAFQLIRELKDPTCLIVDGNQLAKEIIENLKPKFAQKEKMALTIFASMPDKATLSFIKQKKKVASELGVDLLFKEIPFDFSTSDFIFEIQNEGQKKNVKGIIVQLPLPRHFNKIEILNAIPKEKDIDGLSANALALPLSVETVKYILEKYKIIFKNKTIVLNGFGFLIGKPIYRWLCEQGLKENILIVDKKTENKSFFLKKADILISAVGIANLIKPSWLKKEVVLIDFGCQVKENRVYGDFEPLCKEKARLFTKTPGGTGPLLCALIFKNLFHLSEINGLQNKSAGFQN